MNTDEESSMYSSIKADSRHALNRVHGHVRILPCVQAGTQTKRQMRSPLHGNPDVRSDSRKCR